MLVWLLWLAVLQSCLAVGLDDRLHEGFPHQLEGLAGFLLAMLPTSRQTPCRQSSILCNSAQRRSIPRRNLYRQRATSEMKVAHEDLDRLVKEIDKPRVRFAPSPTGVLHVGGARTFLFNYLFAKKYGGEMILRIEDTDVERSTKESEVALLDGLKWAGFSWDEGPDVGGGHGPYRQSERSESGIYREKLEQLITKKKVYRCFLTDEDLLQMREEAAAKNQTFQLKSPWARASQEKIQEMLDAGAPYAYRFKIPRRPRVSFTDMVLGQQSFPTNALGGDFVVMRSNGLPMYNFAAVVDDGLMNISHVLRAQEHLSNTPKQILLFDALGMKPPTFAHMPLILAPDGSKLSKRHGAASVGDYKDKGFLPIGIINYLAMLGAGWGNQEIRPMSNLEESFDIGMMKISNSKFNITKAEWVNSQHLRHMPLEEFKEKILDELSQKGLVKDPPSKFIDKLAEDFQERITLLPEIGDYARELLSYPLEETLASEEVKKLLADNSIIDTAKVVLQQHSDGKLDNLGKDPDALEELAKAIASELGVKKGKVYKPLRICLTGRASGLDLGLLMEVLRLVGDGESILFDHLVFEKRMEELARIVANPPPPPSSMETAPAETKPPAPAPAAAEPEGPVPYEKLDVRVGQIIEAWEHPDSDKLWCEKIDLNEAEGPRQICSGIRQWYKTKEELEGKKVIVVCNLKKARLGGVESNGMVLCASSADKETVAFVEPPATAGLGERVLMEGSEPIEPASGTNMKKKKWMEKAAEDLRAVDAVATYMGKPLVVGGGKCVSPTVSEGTIN